MLNDMKNNNKIIINEVGPRDGFQNHRKYIPTNVKVAIVQKLLDCGFNKIEVSSFVSKLKVPQMADAGEVVEEVKEKARDKGVILSALVPNIVGARNAVNAGIDELSFILSVSESHNMANTSQTIEESLIQLDDIRNKFPAITLGVSFATSFNCIFEGEIPPEKVISLCQRVLDFGVDLITLSDTTGMANPFSVSSLLKLYKQEFPGRTACLHFHDTAGMGLANVLTAIDLDYFEFDSSIGGLGGCPFSPGAAGNISTEDLLNMINAMGLPCDISDNKLLDVLMIVIEKVSPCNSSHMVTKNFNHYNK